MSRPADSASRSVTRGIMRGLETGQFVPGQRLVETDLAQRFSVGRNAVREAVQWLAAKGVVDAARHRSPALRLLDAAEAGEVLAVAEPLIGLAARGAAASGRADELAPCLAEMAATDEPGGFAQARRHFLAILLTASNNRELQRLFPSLGLQIFYAQYRGVAFQRGRLADFQAVHDAVRSGSSGDAEKAGRRHIVQLDAALRAVAKIDVPQMTSK